MAGSFRNELIKNSKEPIDLYFTRYGTSSRPERRSTSARAASGHEAAVPTITLMKSRRLISHPED
jgi:hypothetical protein